MASNDGSGFGGGGGPAASNPGTGLDDIIWEIAGDETYEAFDVNIRGFFNFTP